MEAANEAKRLILEENQSAQIDVLKLDLSSVKSIGQFVDKFNALKLPLNILMYNLILTLFLSLLCQFY